MSEEKPTEHHIDNAWGFADAQAGRAFEKFAGTGLQGFIAFLCLVFLAGIFSLVIFGCYLASTSVKVIADNAVKTAEKLEDVRDLQTKADARGEVALRMMSAVPEVLHKQTILLESLSKRQDLSDIVSASLLTNQKTLLENQRAIIEVLQRLATKADGALDIRTRRDEGGESKTRLPVLGGHQGFGQ